MSSLSPSSKLLSLIGTAIAVVPVQADEFSWQLSGITSRAETGDFARDSWAIDGTYYVNPIDDSGGPYALASFLNPTTRVSAAASKSDTDIVDDPTAYTLGGAYVLPGDKWYVGASYADADAENLPPVTRSDSKGYGVLAGRYLGANTTLELGLGRSENSFESFTPCQAGVPCTALSVFPYAVETTTDSVGLEVFHVRRFRSLTYSLRGGVSQSEAAIDIVSPLPSLVPATQGDVGSVRVYSVAGEVFPTNRLGIRVDYSRPDGERVDGDTYGVAATWFFKPRIAVQFSLSRASLDDAPVPDPESAGVRFIGRF